MKLRCVFYDPDAVDPDDRMTERALEACARADVDELDVRASVLGRHRPHHAERALLVFREVHRAALDVASSVRPLLLPGLSV